MARRNSTAIALAAALFTVHLTAAAAGGRRAVGDYLPGRDYQVDALTAARLIPRGFTSPADPLVIAAAAYDQAVALAIAAEDGSPDAADTAARAAAAAAEYNRYIKPQEG